MCVQAARLDGRETWIYDVRLSAGITLGLPTMPVEGLTLLLYVFKGDLILVSKRFNDIKKEAVKIDYLLKGK